MLNVAGTVFVKLDPYEIEHWVSNVKSTSMNKLGPTQACVDHILNSVLNVAGTEFVKL